VLLEPRLALGSMKSNGAFKQRWLLAGSFQPMLKTLGRARRALAGLFEL
jgi:hypothetical protein